MGDVGLLAPGSDPALGLSSGEPPQKDKADRQLMALVRSAAYEAFCVQPRLWTFMDEFLDGLSYLHKRKIMRYTQPHTTTVTPAHYDLIYLRGGTSRVVTAWIPIGDVPVEMGGVVYLEGSHALGARMEAEFTRNALDLTPEERISAYNRNMTEGGWVSKDLPDMAGRFNARWLVADYEAGDVVIHSPFMIHASTTNFDPHNRIRLSTDIRFQNVNDEIDARWSNHWSLNDMLVDGCLEALRGVALARVVHAPEELVENRFHALLVVVAGLAAGLEHVAEDIVIGVLGAPARIGARAGRRLRIGLGLRVGRTAAAAQHLLEDLAERIVGGDVGRRPALRLGGCGCAAAQHVLQDLAERIVARNIGRRSRLRRVAAPPPNMSFSTLPNGLSNGSGALCGCWLGAGLPPAMPPPCRIICSMISPSGLLAPKPPACIWLVDCLNMPPISIAAIAGSICFSTFWPMPVACAACEATARDRSFEPNRWPRMPLPSAIPSGEKAREALSKYWPCWPDASAVMKPAMP